MSIGVPGKFESDEPNGSNGSFKRLLSITSDTTEITKINNILLVGYAKINNKLLPLYYTTRNALAYLLDPREIAARTYAQYIARKSRSQKWLKMIQERNIFGGQWSSSNFQPTMKEWDYILNSIGWQTKKIKYDLEGIISKVQLGQNLTLEEEVFYLEKGFGMTNEDAKRILHISNNKSAGILVD